MIAQNAKSVHVHEHNEKYRQPPLHVLLESLYQQISAPATAVINALYSFTCGKAECYPSVGRIAKRANLSKRQTQRHLKKLAELGLIEIAINAKEAIKTNIYRLRFDRILNPTDAPIAPIPNENITEPAAASEAPLLMLPPPPQQQQQQQPLPPPQPSMELSPIVAEPAAASEAPLLMLPPPPQPSMELPPVIEPTAASEPTPALAESEAKPAAAAHFAEGDTHDTPPHDTYDTLTLSNSKLKETTTPSKALERDDTPRSKEFLIVKNLDPEGQEIVLSEWRKAKKTRDIKNPYGYLASLARRYKDGELIVTTVKATERRPQDVTITSQGYVEKQRATAASVFGENPLSKEEQAAFNEMQRLSNVAKLSEIKEMLKGKI